MQHKTGLTTKEVLESRKKYGTNSITTLKKDSFFKLFLETLGDPIIKILLIALAVKTIFLFQDFDWYETLGIVIAILVMLSYLFAEIVLANNFDKNQILSTITNFRTISDYLIHALTLGVTIIVVSVPEGLPMMITLVLSSNMKRMLTNNVLVRKLVGIETAGSLNILFTDKTGTLTKGTLEVVEVTLANNKTYNHLSELPSNYRRLFIENLVYNNDAYYDKTIDKIVGGNTTDRALLNFVKLNPSSSVKIISKTNFNSLNKYSTCTINLNGEKKLLIKGSYEKILPYCDFYYNEEGLKLPLKNPQTIESIITNKSRNGMRIILVAEGSDLYRTSFKHLTLVGIISIKDEIRNEVKEALALVTKAHIQTVLITGDNKDTAQSIAKEVGLITSPQDLLLTSSELNNMSDSELKEKLPYLKVISRALPQDKSRLVKLSQEQGLVVGMTGDGVNDAPALKKSDVGFAMGSGTDVAKEAGDIVIIDNNFLSITKAILYGRTVFKSIRKFIIFQLTINMCAISISIIGPFIGIDTPVTVIQMLWINMVMDTLAGLAFSYEPPDLDYMNEYPKTKTEAILNPYMLNEILITGLYSSLLCLFFLKSPFINSFYRSNTHLMSAFFGLFIFMGIFNSLNSRTTSLNIFKYITKNKIFILIISLIALIQILMIYYGGTIFRTIGLNTQEFLLMIILASTVIPIDILRKLILKILKKQRTI